MTTLSASLRVGFGAGAGANLRIIEDDSIISQRYAYARLYPYLRLDQVRIVAIGGTVDRLGKRVSQVQRDLISFTGGSEATATHWPTGNLTIRATSQAYDSDGISIGFPILSVDAGEGVIRASQKFYGYAEIDYQTEYVFLKFDRGQTLLTSGSAATWGEVDNDQPIARRILALEIGGDGKAIYQVPDAVQETQEVYRVTSSYIVDAAGAWEKPPGWPSTNTYPDGSTGPSLTGSIELSRTHEIASIGLTGGLVLHGNQANSGGDWYAPYNGITTYSPSYALERQTPSGDYAARAVSIDQTSLEADLQNRFPGIAL